jgi:hypothetical protein
MIGTKCPGQDMRYWTAEDAHEEKCPQCGEMIEFFKTDIRLRCRNCKTRVANSRFNMGCAEWCAYAEQCLGSAARGLKTKSLKDVMGDELARLAGSNSETTIKIKEIVARAEDVAKEKRLNMLPLIAAIVIRALTKKDLISEPSLYLEELSNEHSLPQQAVKETAAIIEEAGQEKRDSAEADLVYSLTETL